MSTHQFSAEFREGLPFLGGSLWIDFLNTTPIIKGELHDLIATESGVAAWTKLANIGLATDAALDKPVDLQALRTLLAEAFDHLAASKPLSETLIGTINDLIARTAVRSYVLQIGEEAKVMEHLDLVGPPVATAVAWDFARFLHGFEHQRMRHCDNPACVMQFYDIGKNNRRRWCTMSLCGNRNKVAQYRGRKSAGKTA